MEHAPPFSPFPPPAASLKQAAPSVCNEASPFAHLGSSPFFSSLQAFVSVCTKLGKRKKQEDRATTVPRVHNRDDIMFLGIFDGTVGDFAADTVHATISDYMLNSKASKGRSGPSLGLVCLPMMAADSRPAAPSSFVSLFCLLSLCHNLNGCSLSATRWRQSLQAAAS
jgi:hypothetical protein